MANKKEVFFATRENNIFMIMKNAFDKVFCDVKVCQSPELLMLFQKKH